MKALFDTNVVIDYLVQRQPFYESARSLLEMVLTEEIEGVISAATVTDIYYIVTKHIGSKQAIGTIKDLVEVLEITDTKALDIEEAFKLDFPDFEDAVQCAVAIRLKADACSCPVQDRRQAMYFPLQLRRHTELKRPDHSQLDKIL